MLKPIREDAQKPATRSQVEKTEIRLAMGEAWMMCSDCGAKLYSFDGQTDASRKCPYMKHGKCEPR